MANEYETVVTKKDWLNPLNRLALQKAFRAKAPQVVLPDGRRFRMTYTKEKVSFYTIPTDKFPNPFVPKGTFDLKTVLRDDWLMEQIQRTI